MTGIDRDLEVIVCRKAKVTLSEAAIWLWRVLNEYPADLQGTVRAWAGGQDIPKVEHNNVSLERILAGTSLGFMDAIDLLYILSRDPAAGYDIFQRSLGRDRR